MPRLTFKSVVTAALALGITLERKSATCYEFWRPGQDHTIGEASTLAEAWADIQSF